jgi:DNA-binding CsgD family transcriptional regulator/tetratricopeptide (TPR) repeat protein
MADQTGYPAPLLSSPPLVGREREQAALREALDAAVAGHGTFVLIGGEAGIGKTALAEWLLAEAIGRDALVLVGRCYDLSETPPYGPWAEALADAPIGEGLTGLPQAVLPPHRHDGVAVTLQGDISRHLRTYLTALAASRPLVLFLDDLHWADPASLDLLRVLARNLADLPIVLLATYRDDELTIGHPVAVVLLALVRESRADRLALTRLGGDATRILAQARYHLLPVDEDRLVGYLQARAEGNPLYLGELLRSLEEEGVLRQDLGMADWAFGDPTGARVPPLLRQLIGGRAARLGAESGRLLEIAAVIGQAVPLALWAAAAGSDEEVLSDTVEQAVAARLLAETPDGAGVRFAHALVREALYEAIPLPRRRSLHRRAAAALLATPVPDPDAVANHLQRAGDPRAAEWLVEAGHRALRAFANRTAAARYEAALAVVDQETDNHRLRGWCLLYLSQARYLDDARGGIAQMDEAMRLAAVANDRALAAYARYLLGFYQCAIGDFRRGITEMIAGTAALDALSVAERGMMAAQVHHIFEYVCTLALRFAYVGRYEEARSLALRSREQGPNPRAEYVLGEVHAALGRADDALQSWARGRAMSHHDGNHWNVGLFALFEMHGAVLPYRADDLVARQRLADESERAIAAAGDFHNSESVRVGRLPLLALEGHWAEARAIAAGVCDRGRAYRPAAASILAGIAYAQGDTALAASLVVLLLPAGPAEEPGGTWHYDALRLQRLAAQLALDAGDFSAAHAWLVAQDRWTAWNGAVRGRGEGYLAWASYHRAVGDMAQARNHAEMALTDATEPRQPLALLVAHRFLGELDSVVGEHVDAQKHLSAALSLGDACAAPYERALILLALVELCLATGDRRGAAVRLEDACTLLVPLDARPALRRADVLASRLVPISVDPSPAALPFGLTAREMEVLRLVAAGLTTARIAEQLYLSTNTVNTHLRAIYGKLGVASRSAATRLAFEHHLV